MPAAHWALRKKNVSKADTAHAQHEFQLGEAFSFPPIWLPKLEHGWKQMCIGKW